jgi:polyvinyl alcohol dehydrogenase (cytochrome)
MHGPAGAAVWLSPAIDAKRNVLYIGTGNAYSDPETKYADAVIAMDLDSGTMKWVRLLTPGDGWNFACVNPTGGASCPQAVGPDVDIGSSPILKSLPGGKSVLLIGQKSGIVHALDPDDDGRMMWQTRIGKGGAMGGIVWDMAADEERVYVTLSDLSQRQAAGGLFAPEIGSGERAW